MIYNIYLPDYEKAIPMQDVVEDTYGTWNTRLTRWRPYAQAAEKGQPTEGVTDHRWGVECSCVGR